MIAKDSSLLLLKAFSKPYFYLVALDGVVRQQAPSITFHLCAVSEKHAAFPISLIHFCFEIKCILFHAIIQNAVEF